MSAWIKKYSLADISDQSLIVALIEADAETDLPGISDFTGYTLQKGSEAHVIADNTSWMLNSSGTWILQEQSPYKDVYTKSQVNTLITDLDNTIALVDAVVRLLNAAEPALINTGAKNLLNVFTVTSPQVINGITWTINADGTITASGTANANSFLYLMPNNTNIAYGYETVISGCPAGGDAATYEIQVAMVGGTTYHDYGDGAAIPDDYVYRYFVCCVRSGQSIPAGSPLVFKPMICRKSFADITNDFVPYAPSNADLYQMIRSYHP